MIQTGERLALRTLIRLIRWIAPDDLQTALIGDLQERHINATGKAPLWIDGLRSLIALLSLRIEQAILALRPSDLWIGSVGFSLVWLWELGVVRHISWPIARDIVSVSPLTNAQTCMSVYIALYALLCICVAVPLTGAVRRGWVSHWSRGLCLVALFSPALTLLILPTPTDGTLFRLAQIMALSLSLYLAMWRRPQRQGLA